MFQSQEAEWAENVWGKLEFDLDLHAADVVYQASVQCHFSGGKTDSIRSMVMILIQSVQRDVLRTQLNPK